MISMKIEEIQHRSSKQQNGEKAKSFQIIRLGDITAHHRMTPTEQNDCEQLVQERCDHECNEELFMYRIVLYARYVRNPNEAGILDHVHGEGQVGDMTVNE